MSYFMIGTIHVAVVNGSIAQNRPSSNRIWSSVAAFSSMLFVISWRSSQTIFLILVV